MPHLILHSNVVIEHTAEVLQALDACAADITGKPAAYIMSECQGGLSMHFAGTDEPCAKVDLISLGLDESATGRYADRICGLLHELLNIPPARVYIGFHSPQRHLFGWNGSTF